MIDNSPEERLAIKLYECVVNDINKLNQAFGQPLIPVAYLDLPRNEKVEWINLAEKASRLADRSFLGRVNRD